MGLIQPTVETWLPPAAVQLQEHGPDWLEIVDGKPWSAEQGFHRGFSSSFRLRAGREIWFHFPFPTPAGASVDRVSLLWECADGAAITWAVLHHGGMDRRHLFEPGTPLTGTPEPFDPPAQWRQYYPACARVRADLPVDPPMPLHFGLQLCVLVRAGEQAGTVRFYGAGARFFSSA